LILQRFDAAYLDRLRAGDPATEQDFVTYFSALVVIKVRSRIRSAQIVEDTRQETFLRVFRALRSPGGIRSPEGLGAFVNSICNNVLLESLRLQKRHPPAPETGNAALHDDTPGPEATLLSEERRREVRRILDTLSPRDRGVLKALFFKEREKDEVCAELGVGRDYLRVLLHRAKTQFREHFLEEEAARGTDPDTSEKRISDLGVER
jgi:RNA polymerase sigma-70 factor (ECF subfamily)